MKITICYFHFENRLTFKVQAVTIICVKMHNINCLSEKGTGSIKRIRGENHAKSG